MSWCSFRQSKHLALVDCVPSMGAPQSQQKIVAAVIEPCADGAMGMGVSRSMDDILIFFFGFRWRGMCGVCVAKHGCSNSRERAKLSTRRLRRMHLCVWDGIEH